VRFLNQWDPALIIDTHTTNGSYHRHTLTYAGPRLPAGDAKVLEFVREEMLPDVGRRVEEQTGYQSLAYGNFNEDGTRWTTYPPLPRYGTPYRGLRNRLAVLTEAHAYASYKDRILCTKAFVQTCFSYVAERAGDVRELLKKADQETIEKASTPGPMISWRFATSWRRFPIRLRSPVTRSSIPSGTGTTR